MTCEEATLLISGHLDGENTPQEEQLLQAHLAECAQCRQRLRHFAALDAQLAELETPPETLRSDIMAAIRAEAAQKKTRRPWRRLGSWMAAAALTLAVGFGAWQAFVPANGEPETAAPMMARSVAAPAEYALEVAASPVAPDGGSAQLAMDVAEDRQADVVLLFETLPELENCQQEELEHGAVLYLLETADGAVALSRQYGAALYQPETGAVGACSYALVVEQR